VAASFDIHRDNIRHRDIGQRFPRDTSLHHFQPERYLFCFISKSLPTVSSFALFLFLSFLLLFSPFSLSVLRVVFVFPSRWRAAFPSRRRARFLHVERRASSAETPVACDTLLIDMPFAAMTPSPGERDVYRHMSIILRLRWRSRAEAPVTPTHAGYDAVAYHISAPPMTLTDIYTILPSLTAHSKLRPNDSRDDSVENRDTRDRRYERERR